MTDALYDALESFRQFMDAAAGGRVVAYFVLALIIPPLAIVAHEAGHALVARRFGVPIRAFIAAPEGPAVTVQRNGLSVRIGLGLGRDLRSQEPAGWVVLELPALPPEQAIAILRAGPLAEGAFAILLLAAAAVPQPLPSRILLALTGTATLMNARANLRDRTHPNSDGSQIQRILELHRHAPPIPGPAPLDDPHAGTSVAPPGY